MTVWLEFAFSTVVIVAAAIKLAQYGDVIAARTRLGGMFVGTLLLAGATSLPELLTAINSINQDVPDLTVGNIFGSSMFNMFLIGLLDLTYRQGRILRRVAVNHALTASLAILLTGSAIFFIWAKIDFHIGWMGVDSLVLMAIYILGARVIQSSNVSAPPSDDDEDLSDLPTMQSALIGFSIAAVVLIFITPLLVSSSVGVAAATGLTTGFVGLALLAIATSLPEVVTTIAAVRIGAFDLAVGNLFGSNIFNIFALGLTDLFYTKGDLLFDLEPMLAIAGVLALLLTSLALIGNLARGERRILFVEVDALVILLLYGFGMFFLYSRGIS